MLPIESKPKYDLKIFEDNHIDFLKILEHYEIIMQFTKTRVLVIDDEEFCISAMKALLHKFKFDINY